MKTPLRFLQMGKLIWSLPLIPWALSAPCRPVSIAAAMPPRLSDMPKRCAAIYWRRPAVRTSHRPQRCVRRTAASPRLMETYSRERFILLQPESSSRLHLAHECKARGGISGTPHLKERTGMQADARQQHGVHQPRNDFIRPLVVGLF